MDWMEQLGGVLQQYNGTGAAPAQANVHDEFDQIAQNAPQSAMSDGLAAAFRSEQTPEFGQMAAQLFNNSNNQQRAGILNTLISVVGPTVLSHILSRRAGAGSGGGNGLSGLIGLLSGGQQTEITPEQAAQVPAEAVGEIVAQAEKKDPSVIDQLSNFYAQHPTLVKSLGAAVLAIAMAKIAQRQQG
jgi:hypothetical protein